MSKAILVLDEMPKDCKCCPVHFLDIYNNNSYRWWCGHTLKTLETTARPDWCPLKEFSNKKEKTMDMSLMEMSEVDGYNACLDEILGE